MSNNLDSSTYFIPLTLSNENEAAMFIDLSNLAGKYQARGVNLQDFLRLNFALLHSLSVLNDQKADFALLIAKYFGRPQVDSDLELLRVQEFNQFSESQHSRRGGRND